MSVRAHQGRLGIPGLLPLLVAVSGTGCSHWDAEAQARNRAKEVLECGEVVLQARSEFVFDAAGCDRAVGIACTSAANEPVCIPVRFAGAAPTSGGEARASLDDRPQSQDSVSTARYSDGAQYPEGPEGRVEQSPSGSASTSASPDTGASSDTGPSSGTGASSGTGELPAPEVRAYLDAQVDNILACVGTERVLVRGEWNASGQVEFALPGALQDSLEEGCVQAALMLRVETDRAGALLHLVHRTRSPTLGSDEVTEATDVQNTDSDAFRQSETAVWDAETEDAEAE